MTVENVKIKLSSKSIVATMNILNNLRNIPPSYPLGSEVEGEVPTAVITQHLPSPTLQENLIEKKNFKNIHVYIF